MSSLSQISKGWPARHWTSR